MEARKCDKVGCFQVKRTEIRGASVACDPGGVAGDDEGMKIEEGRATDVCDLVGSYPSPAEQRGNLEQWGGLDGSCTR